MLYPPKLISPQLFLPNDVLPLGLQLDKKNPPPKSWLRYMLATTQHCSPESSVTVSNLG